MPYPVAGVAAKRNQAIGQSGVEQSSSHDPVLGCGFSRGIGSAFETPRRCGPPEAQQKDDSMESVQKHKKTHGMGTRKGSMEPEQKHDKTHGMGEGPQEARKTQRHFGETKRLRFDRCLDSSPHGLQFHKDSSAEPWDPALASPFPGRCSSAQLRETASQGRGQTKVGLEIRWPAQTAAGSLLGEGELLRPCPHPDGYNGASECPLHHPAVSPFHQDLMVHRDIPTDGPHEVGAMMSTSRPSDGIQVLSLYDQLGSEWQSTQGRKSYAIDISRLSLHGLLQVKAQGFRHVNQTVLPKGIELHAATEAAIRNLLPVDWGRVESLAVYTDGSAGLNHSGHRSSAWAYAIIAQMNGGEALVHWDNGEVIVSDADTRWLGATQHNAAGAEVAALQQATIWAIQQHCTGPLYFCFDNQAAGFGALGWWKHDMDKVDQRTLRAMQQLLERQTCGNTHATHIKAHAGHRWNELVDGLAQMAMRQGIQSSYPQPDLRQDIRHPRGNAAWWWLFHQIMMGDSTLPQMSGAELKWSIPTKVPDVEQVWVHEPVRSTKMRHGTLRLLQYNVLSMSRLGSVYDQKDGINTHATYIKSQLESADIHIAGFQECRTRTSATINSLAWSRITSAAKNGHGGCELWLRRSYTLDGHGNNDLDTAHCLTVFASPELSVVRTAICGSPILCVVGHAPHTGASQEKIETWWRVLQEQMQPFKDIPTISFLDANAHFDGPHLPHIGGHQPEAKRYKAADHMLQFLLLTETVAINTFPTHCGAAATWHHPAYQTQHRTDYICIR